MFDSDYRSAVKKIAVNERWRADTLQKMQNAQRDVASGAQLILARRKRISQHWAVACAAALVLAAMPVAWQAWNTPSLAQSATQAEQTPSTAAAEPFDAAQRAPTTRERAAVFAMQQDTESVQQDTVSAQMNPTENLAQDELPAALPVYYESVQTDSGQVLEQTAKALGVTVQTEEESGQGAYAMAGDWKLTIDGDAVRVEAQDGVLMTLEEGVAKETAPDFYASRLSGSRTWRWDGANAKRAQCFAQSDETLDKRLYRYCFERLTMELDDSGNLTALECRLPQLQQGQAMTLVSLDEARKTAALSAESVQSTALSYARDEAGVWSPVYIFTTAQDAQTEKHQVSAVLQATQ